MAKSKKTNKSKPSKKHPKSTKALLTTSTKPPKGDPDHLAVLSVRARWPELAASEIEAFTDLLTDSDRAALGRQTKAVGVRADAVRYAVQIDRAFSQYSELLSKYYSRTRFAYFLHCLGALDAQVELDQTHALRPLPVADGELVARAERARLLSKLRGYAGRRASENASISDSLGVTNTSKEVAASIASLVRLARAWLVVAGTKAQIQRASAGLTKELVDDAEAAGLALSEGRAAATLAGPARAQDSPEANLREGDVLHEMQEAKRCFDEAHDETQLIARLSPGSATRHVLAPNRKKKLNEQPPAPTGGPVVGSSPVAQPTS